GPDRLAPLPEPVKLLVRRGKLEKRCLGFWRQMRPAFLEPLRSQGSKVPPALGVRDRQGAKAGGCRALAACTDQHAGDLQIGQLGAVGRVQTLAQWVVGMFGAAKGLFGAEWHLSERQGAWYQARQAVAAFA